MSVSSPEEKKAVHFDKEEERLFEIITGKLRFPTNKFREYDLSPDLIIKIRVPNSQYIPKGDYLELSNYVAFPSQKLERAFQKAEKMIIEEMGKKKENKDPSNLRIRMQKALVPCELATKTTHFINEYNEEEPMEMEAIYQNSGELDCFTIEYNAIVYILQELCGFRVRSFLLYDDRQEQKEIFLFLTLSAENLVNLAKKYRIKKQIEYTFIDFFLNDPTGHDHRPLKYSTPVRTDLSLLTPIKHINRHFRATNSAHENTDLVEESDLSDQQLLNFRDYVEEATELYEHFKYKRTREISNREKSYIFEYNRKKINPGCEDMFALVRHREEFFQLNKQVLKKYGYQFREEPLVYQEFNLPDKESKNSSFFDKLYSLLLYKPMVVGERGDLDLFLNMEKSKLCYLAIKNHFKLSYLRKIGFDFLTLSSNYEKFGKDGTGGGINGRHLESEWSVYAMFPNINTIRNYVGDNVGFQVLITSELVQYFLLILVPFALCFLVEQVFGPAIFVYTTLLETLLFAISYQIYLQFWEVAETEYVKNYSDAVSSKIFLSDYRGPYVRNLLTDEVNEFHSSRNFMSSVVDTLCVLIIVALLVIMGSVFHGCRKLLLAIHDPMSSLIVSSLSLPHIVAYLVFFFVVDLAAIVATNRLISLMVRLQNPPTDEEEEEWREKLTFFYLIGLQLIPPFFFFILEPFNGNSCFADQCIAQIQFYVYARIITTFIISGVRLGHVFLFKYLHTKEFFRKDPPQLYQDKLGALLGKALKESKRKDHVVDNNETIIILINYSIYCNVLPLVSILAFLALYMKYTNERLGVLYEERRPINRSERVLPFSPSLRIIYYIGIISQAWISVFPFEFVQLHFQDQIDATSTAITYQGIFLFKLVAVAAYFLILLCLSKIAASITKGFNNNAMLRRKDHKFKEYLQSRGKLKIELSKTYEPVPVKTVFRSFNPQKTNEEVLEEMLHGIKQVSIPMEEDDSLQNLDSLNHITHKKLR